MRETETCANSFYLMTVLMQNQDAFEMPQKCLSWWFREMWIEYHCLSCQATPLLGEDVVVFLPDHVPWVLIRKDSVCGDAHALGQVRGSTWLRCSTVWAAHTLLAVQAASSHRRALGFELPCGWMPYREHHMKKAARKDLKKKIPNFPPSPFPSHPQGECSAADFRLLCNLQRHCQNATAMSHGKTFQPNTSPRGVEEPTIPFCIAAALMSHTAANFAGSPSSCLVKTVDIQFVPGQE